jgi:AraC-like DNA-binding protein
MEKERRQRSPYFLTFSYVLPLFNHIKEQGYSVTPLLDLLGLCEADLAKPDVRMDHSLLNEMWALAESITGDENIGLHAGMNMQIGHIGMLGHLILTCETAGETYDFVARFNNLVGNGDLVEFEYGDDEVTMRCTICDSTRQHCRHHAEYNLASWATLGRWVSSSDKNPTAIYSPSKPPANDVEQKSFFGCPVYYETGNSIEFVVPKAYSDLPLMAGDPLLRQALEAAARDRLLELQGQQLDSDPLRRKLKQFIVSSLYQGAPTLEAAAAHLDIGARKLQKDLERRGSTYKQLLDSVRQEQAGMLVTDVELLLVDVALMLGFSEQSSFQRAFKRWFDVTPTEYRKAQLND